MKFPKAIVLMMVGYHCDESLEEIIKRKEEEKARVITSEKYICLSEPM